MGWNVVALSARYQGLPAHLIVVAILTVLALGIGLVVRSIANRHREDR